MKWEERVARTVSATGLPVPAVYGIIEVDGRHGILYENVAGPSMLKTLESNHARLKQFARTFGELHASMHAIRGEGLSSQRQQLEKKIRGAASLPRKLKLGALEALRQLPDDNLLCHGDFHPDNILMSKRGPVIIDWNDASQGKPEADIARTLLLLRQGEPPRPLSLDIEDISSIRTQFIQNYLNRYKEIQSISIDEVDSWRLPIAAARLSEGIEGERDRLLSVVKSLIESV